MLEKSTKECLYVVCGVLSVLIVFYYVQAIAGLWRLRDGLSRLIWAWGIAVLMSGWATNSIEGAISSMLLGLTLAYSSQLQADRKMAWHGARTVRALRSARRAAMRRNPARSTSWT